MKKVLSFTLSVIMLLSVFTGLSFEAFASTGGHTQAEAVAWANAHANANSALDYDGSYGAQCVDLIAYYYAYLGVPVAMGHAYQFKNGGKFCPSGWTYQSSPQPGDIAVWTGGDYGHVAIVTEIRGAQMVCVEQNYNYKQYCTANLHNIDAVTYIHPDFPSPTPVNNPIGTVDSVTAGDGYIQVSGWAFDPDDSTASIPVHVYVGGSAGTSGADCYTISANKTRDDVNNAYGISGKHGFSSKLATKRTGAQSVYVYAINIGSGNDNPMIGSKAVAVAADTQGPVISDVTISEVSSKGYRVTCIVKDNILVDRVQFPTWTLYNGQDDLFANWPSNTNASGTKSGNSFTYYVKASEHNNEQGSYATHIYAYDFTGNETCYHAPVVNVHDHNYTWVTDKAATCTANGSKHQECSKCGEIIKKGTTIFSLGHSWSTPTYTWSSDNKTCTATRVCSRDSSHKETQTVNTTSQILRQPTMTQTGTAKYTAVFSNPAFSTQTKSVSLPKTYDGFPDVKEGSWYYDAVKYCAQSGFMSGYQNGNFGPNDSLKRQDFVVILANIAKADLSKYQNTDSKLKDVKKGAYYAAAVNWAVDKNIIAGYDNGNFGVNDNITREQIAVILYRYKNEPAVGNITATLSKFSDYKNTSAFAVPAMAWAVQQGAISGNDDGTLAPTKTASRAQIASIIMRMDQKGMFK